MFTPRFTRAFRPRTTQCLRQQLFKDIAPVPRNGFRGQQQRFQSRKTFSAASKELFREYPYSVSVAVVIILLGSGTLLYSNHIYRNYIIGAFHKFPEPVAKQLRKALYYTNQSLEPKLAVKYYKEALRVADEIGMDPFSDEIIGVKIQLAALMERIQHYGKAAEILEIVKRDNLMWIRERGSLEGNAGQRTSILKKTVGISVKLGEIYANEYVKEREKAEQSLVWAVETVLKESKRRKEEGVKEGEGEWVNDEEQGASLEALGHHYEEQNKHYLAAPLFLQALTMSPANSCHTAVLMNNLSISLAQQQPTTPLTPANTPPPSHSSLVASAREWALKAIAVTQKITPPNRTEECDLGCAVATHNLGEFAEMGGDIREARKRYEEARLLSKGIGFVEGQQNAVEGLKRLEGK